MTRRSPSRSKGLAPADIKRRLWEESSVQIADGNHYSAAVFRHLGRSALCRASFAHYDDAETARTFLKALEPLIEQEIMKNAGPSAGQAIKLVRSKKD